MLAVGFVPTLHITMPHGPDFTTQTQGGPFALPSAHAHMEHTRQHPKPQGAPLRTALVGRRLCQVHGNSSVTPPSPRGEKPTWSQCSSRVREVGCGAPWALPPAPEHMKPPQCWDFSRREPTTDMKIHSNSYNQLQPRCKHPPGPTAAQQGDIRQDRSLGQPMSCCMGFKPAHQLLDLS